MRVLSAATVLRADDGGRDCARWSYLRLAGELQRYSADPRTDKVDLFRRMVFNALVSNTDDHPRLIVSLRAMPASDWRRPMT